MCAALLKLNEWLTQPFAAAESTYGRLAAIEIELILGWLLLASPDTRVPRLLGLCFFTSAASISLSKVVAGEASCGCFGTFEVPPLATLLLDAFLLTALLCWQPSGCKRPSEAPSCWRRSRVGVPAAALLALPLAAAVWQHRVRSEDGAGVLGESLVAGKYDRNAPIEPRRWIGRRLPFMSEIETDVDLTRGPWVLLFHRHGCGVCKRAVDRLRARCDPNSPRSASDVRYAIVELAPRREETTARGHAPFTFARIVGASEWLMETPVLLVLDQGVVTSAVSGKAVLDHASLEHTPSRGRAVGSKS